jgi:glycerol uptake facilitator-like aquaporin
MKSQPYLLRRASAEFVGTFALVSAGCGAIVVNHQTGALSHVGVALTFGLIITVMIAALGHLSGAHFNPAVTLAFALVRRFSWREVPIYIMSQSFGPALVTGTWSYQWIYWLIPIVGASLGALVYEMIRLPLPDLALAHADRTSSTQPQPGD